MGVLNLFGMFTAGMTLNTNATGTNPLPAGSSVPFDTNIAAGGGPETVAVTIEQFGQQAPTALTDAASIATAMQNAMTGLQQTAFSVTLAGNRTLANPTGTPIPNMRYSWRVTQDATGNRTLAYGTMFLFAGGTPTLSTAANAVDLIVGYYDSALGKFLCQLSKAYA